MDKIELVFNMYKEEPIGARKFRAIVSKKYKLNDREISNIYARINNYQISKYGSRTSSEYEVKSAEEYRKIAINRRTAKYERRNRGR